MGLTEKILVLAVGLLIIIFVAVGVINRNDTLKQLKDKYDEALRGTDKDAAWEAGIAYYKSLRGNNELTVDDELEIFKDISSVMKDAEWRSTDEESE
jgi:secreted Zn-dependent insulinase-like peptidase